MKNKGFSLVELIVVIAIMAILVGVAVPVYSSYIEKAEIAKDKQMAGEVAHALELGYTSNFASAEAGYVIINQNADASASNAFVESAMAAAFGENWKQALRLEYNGWDSSSLVSVALSQTDYAEVIKSSPYLTGTTPEALLENVQVLTGAATELFEGVAESKKYELIRGQLFGGDDAAMQAMCKQFGIAINTSGEKPCFENVTDDQLSNFLVFGVASQVGNEESGSSTTAVSGLAKRYADYAAFVNTAPNNENETILDAYKTMNNSLQTARSAANVEAAFSAFETACGSTWSAYYADDATRQKNQIAFKGFMQAVDQTSGSVTAGDIASADYFTSDGINNMLNTYVSAIDMVVDMVGNDDFSLYEALENGAVAIFFFPSKTGYTIDCSVGGLLEQ